MAAAWAPSVGGRVVVAPDGDVATVRYVGAVAGTEGEWVGVEFDAAGRGKHDGVHQGVRYFECRANGGPQCASFVRPHKLSAGVTLLQALTAKYEQARPAARAPPASSRGLG
jgi:dynactin complex subunit